MADQPSYVAFFGVMGATSAMVFSGKHDLFLVILFWCVYVCVCTMLIMNSVKSILALGAAYGTAKSGTGIAAMSVMRPELIMKSIIPVVMAGIIAIYGLVVAVLVGNGSKFILIFLICMENDVTLSFFRIL